MHAHEQAETARQVFYDSNSNDVISAVSPTFNPTVMRRPEGRAVVRFPEQLRLHRALEELGWTSAIDEFNNAARLTNQSVTEPILITTNGTILAGFGRWRLAVFEGRHEINCIEYPLSEDESLQFILTHHQTRRGWNAFVRIRLALNWSPIFSRRRSTTCAPEANTRVWQICRKLSILMCAKRLPDAAGVGARNVSNVKTILEVAHPRLIEALRDGTLTINGAMQFCKLPRAEQLEQFIRHSEERATNKVIRQSVARPKEEKTSPDVAAVLDALQQQEARQPGSVVVQVGRFQRTVILIGQDLLTGPHSQKELKLT